MTVSRPIFDKMKSCETLKRIFGALTMSSKGLKSAEDLILYFEAKPTEDEFQLPKIPKMNDYEQKYTKIAKIIEKLQKKMKKSKIKEDFLKKCQLQMKKNISNPSHIFQD